MSTTIRVSREDKLRLAKLAKRLNVNTMAQALRKAMEIAEGNEEQFSGDIGSLSRTLGSASSHGVNISERVEEELASAVEDESR